ncbi:hypothetical protein GCM10027275_02310 [Rhabdobacter roseus]
MGCGVAVLAQISITFPLNRTVLQRDKNNSATVYIAGNYTKSVDRVEVQLRAINGGGTSDWITIENNPQGGQYRGQVDWMGGWYEMEVRGWKDGNLVGSTTLSRLGIGEVFLIAGQSNAQGYFNYGGPGANDDRVNCIHHYNNNGSGSELPYPEFTHLNSDSYLSPRGNSAWAWGRLGDHLANKLGVPIMFYNAGWYGTSIRNWQQSINGTAYSIYNGEAFTPSGMPYANLRLVMQYYVPMTGIRGVLWLQGEADNFANTSSGSYLNDLRSIINQSRNESGRNLSWVIARCSYDNQRGTDAQVIKGQNDAVTSISNLFYGPDVDQIQVPRPDGVHIQGSGLTDLADAWNNSLNDDFFARSEPYKALPLPTVRASCVGNNAIALSLDGNAYTSISWNNGQSSSTINVGPGTYRARVRDQAGNFLFSPTVNVPQEAIPPTPFISQEGQNPICQGSTLTLVVSTPSDAQWSTGQFGERITVSQAGNYSVHLRSVYGCEASASVSVGVHSTPPPGKPSITAVGATTFCEGGEVTLQSSTSGRSVWSNAQEGGSIQIRSSGDYRVREVDGNGCASPESDPVAVRVNPLPAKPVISTSSSTTICEGERVTLTSNYPSGNTWSTNATEQSITVSQSGQYRVGVRDGNGCESVSDFVGVQVNPLPSVPRIEPLRPTTFCDRDYTVLRASEAPYYQWSNGSSGRELEIRVSGDYSLTVRDYNGCTSPASTPVKVVVNPLPATPTITAGGPTTFCADYTLALRSSEAPGYVWNNGQSSREINTNQAGVYSVRTRSEFGCLSDVSQSITLTVLPLPATPTVTALGPTDFCVGSNVALQASGNGIFFWNNESQGASLIVSESGNYAVRVQGTNGCFSPYSSLIKVDAKPRPSKPVIMQVGTYTLLADTDVTNGHFEWRREGQVLSENTPQIKVRQTGGYVVKESVQYSAVLTCVSDDSELYRFEVESDNGGISIFPNPSYDGKFTVETLDDLVNATIQVYDLRGVLIQTLAVPLFNDRVFIDLSRHSNGMYLIRIQSGSFGAVQKVILNH